MTDVSSQPPDPGDDRDVLTIERGDYPEWELLVQMMGDDEHPELNWDPLDDTKVWPENEFPPKVVGRMVLNRNSTTSSTTTSNWRWAPVCWSTGWTSPRTRC
jgi:catalase